MKTDEKTKAQHNAYFLFQEFVANEMNAQSIPLASLVVEIKPKPTKESLHEIFKSILFAMYGKKSTKGITREQLNACIDVYMDALARIDVHLHFPDSSKQALLRYYD